MMVTYLGNGNTGGTVPTDASAYHDGDTVTVLGNTGNLERTEASFLGWNTESDGTGTTYQAGDTFIMGTDDVSLYAKWVWVLGEPGPAGGLIFYDKGAYSSGWRYLEAAPKTAETANIAWCVGTATEVGGTGEAIGTGEANTDAIVTHQGAGNYAVKYCADLVIGGFDDWFLPSIDEMEKMCKNLGWKYIGSFTNDNYWSSTEFGQYDALCMRFDYATHTQTNKASVDLRIYVRAARAF